jgi:tetratricopeptide (TPR) repeat protein
MVQKTLQSNFASLLLLISSLTPRSSIAAQDVRPLEPGRPIERETVGNDTHSYQITLAAGQFLHVVVEQFDAYVIVKLFGPDGKELIDARGWLEAPQRAWWIAESTGGYRLEVSTRSGKPGRYRVSIEELRPATPQDHLRLAAYNIWLEGFDLRYQETRESIPKAVEKLQEARRLWQALDDRSMEALALLQIIIACNSLGEYQKALEYGHQALALRQTVRDRYWEASVLIFIGEAHHALGEYQKEIEFTEQSLPLWRDPVSEGWALNNIGSAYNAFGEKKLALDYFNQSLLAYQSAEDVTGQALEHTNIGGLLASLGEKQRAIDSLEQALAFWQALALRSPGGDPSRRESRTFYRLGEVYASLGESQTAFDYYDRALRRVREGSDPVVEARILHSIGQTYASLNKHQEALDHLDQALRLRRQIGNRQGEAYTLTYLGTVYFSLGDKRQALDYYDQALPLMRAVGDRYGEAYTLTYLGEAHHSLGDHQRAMDHLSQALSLRRAVEDREGEANTRYQIARVERERGNLDEARAQIERALEIAEFVRHSVLSQELRASYLGAVRDYYDFYIDLLMRMDERRPAEGFAAMALEANEKAQARSLLETLAEARADIRQGVDPQLLARERELQQRLNGKAEHQTKLLNGKHTQEQAEAVAKEIRAITAELQQVKTRIKAASPRYAALTDPQPLKPSQIQRQTLDGEMMLLEYALGDERSYLWAVTPTAIKSYELPRRAEVEAAARRAYDLMTARNHRKDDETDEQRRARIAQADAQCVEALAALSRMLLAPVTPQLGAKRLLIVTQGALQLIPFAALPEPESGRVGERESGRRRGRSPFSPTLPLSHSTTPLIVNHEIITLPSASTLGLLRRELEGRRPAPKTLAVLADPVFSEDDERVRARLARIERKNDKPDFSKSGSLRVLKLALRDFCGDGAAVSLARLFGTLWEADQITALAPPRKRMKAVGFDANRATATSPELGQYRIVHFATHALINRTHPELSGIVLSLLDKEGRPQDGFLRGHELYNLKLPADLVVLSACQTALGKEIKGEGMVGLTRGFMYAGAARVAASLWSLDDQRAAELMVRFYGRMLGPQRMSAAAALRAAQVEMWKDRRWRAPYFWAAFALQGEWK